MAVILSRSQCVNGWLVGNKYEANLELIHKVLWNFETFGKSYIMTSRFYSRILSYYWRLTGHAVSHYNDVIMTTMASQITSLTIVYSAVYSMRRSKKTSKLRVTGLCAGNSPGTGEFPSQRTGNAEYVFIWWRHYASLTVTHILSGTPQWTNMYTFQNHIHWNSTT